MSKVRRQYSKEFIEEAVRLAKTSGKSMVKVAQGLGLNDKTLWNWVQAAKEAEGQGENQSEGKKLTISEREELRQLRRENALLREEREILKKAAAFFAKESK